MSSATISGLSSLRSSLGKTTGGTPSGVDSIMSSLNVALANAVKTKFTARNKLELLSKRTEVRGNKLVGTLTYRQVYSDLSKFPTTWYWGNINSDASSKGRVHVTSVVKGRPNIVYGKSHRGGFILRDKGGSPRQYGRHGTQMVERKSKSKLPLRLLLGPSTSIMIGWALRNDKGVRAVTNGKRIKLSW